MTTTTTTMSGIRPFGSDKRGLLFSFFSSFVPVNSCVLLLEKKKQPETRHHFVLFRCALSVDSHQQQQRPQWGKRTIKQQSIKKMKEKARPIVAIEYRL